MSQVSAAMVGNDFALPNPSLRRSKPTTKINLVRGDNELPIIPIGPVSHAALVPVSINRSAVTSDSGDNFFARLLDTAHKNSFIVFAVLFLIVGASGIEVANRYWIARIATSTVKTAALPSATVAGLNITVPASQLDSRLATISNQLATLEVGNRVLSISPATITSWLKITPSADKTNDYIHLNSQTMTQSLTADANQYAVAPINQVTVTQNGVSAVVVTGQNGAVLSNPSTIATQVASSAKSVMNGSGIKFSTPLSSQAFQAITPSAFGKLLVANLTTNRLYAYQNGQLVNTFLSSDGKPSTPTPVGEFHIWTKLTSQTMTGPGYVQPDVPYVNYFDHSGDALHGVYWRPASVFGYESLSHGCVGLQVNDAKWVYDWAPIGTTVITYKS